MISFLFSIGVCIAVIIASKMLPLPKIAKIVMFVVGVLGILASVLATSFVVIDSNQVGHKKKVYGTSSLTDGKVIATAGEKGYQSDLIPPGVHFIPLVNIFYDVENKEIYEVPENMVGLLKAKDGASLTAGQYVANDWESLYPENPERMLDAKTFLTNGGQKGPQLNVLKPGKYIINEYLWKVSLVKATHVEPGHVVVIKSSVGNANTADCVSTKRATDSKSIVSPLVKEGCFGIWDTPLYPGTYYLNTEAYKPFQVPTRTFAWTYKGGFDYRDVQIQTNDDGTISVVLMEKEQMFVPKDAADSAIKALTQDGYIFWTEWTVQAQVKPTDAPFMVATIESIDNAENTIVTPVIRSEVRNVGESVKGEDFLGKRKEIEGKVEDAIIIEGLKFGITIAEARMRDPGMPGELRGAIVRKDLAKKNTAAYKEEKKTQRARISMMNEKAKADQQPELVKAEIAKQASLKYKAKRRNEAQAERYYYEQVAEGQKAQANILGPELTAQIKMVEMMINAAKSNPELVKVPEVLSIGGEDAGMVGAAILGRSNLASGIGSILKGAAK